MDVALIPPKGLYKWANHTKRQMVLGHMVGDSNYLESFNVRATRLLTTIDNGEAEGQRLDNAELIRAARTARAGEIVVPDAMGDPEETRVRVKEFLHLARGLADPTEFLYMGVAHGGSVDEVMGMVSFCADQGLLVIGLPRLLMQKLGQTNVRIDLANSIRERFPNHHIHLLGTSGLWPKEILFAAKYASHIRSVDTSMPFNYAIQGERLGVSTKAIQRPDRYFAENWSYRAQNHLVEENVAKVMRWANGIA